MSRGGAPLHAALGATASFLQGGWGCERRRESGAAGRGCPPFLSFPFPPAAAAAPPTPDARPSRLLLLLPPPPPQLLLLLQPRLSGGRGEPERGRARPLRPAPLAFWLALLLPMAGRL